ncbi:MAG: sulfur carrier protein ThiS [bacterium]|nr:sulfur carrier protein ThiS [bacterium]
MLLKVNGVEEECADTNLAELVAAKGLRRDSLVVELNGSIIKQELWQTTGLHDGDQVELLNFVGGG